MEFTSGDYNYSIEELREMYAEKTVPGHCHSCGEYVEDCNHGEEWRGGRAGRLWCYGCGRGTRIASVFVLIAEER